MKELLALDGVEMPKNCHDCDCLGISDVVGLKCPCQDNPDVYNFNERPENCPLIELTFPSIEGVWYHI